MKYIYMKTITLLFVFSATIIMAQLPSSGVSLESNVLDGVYVQEHIPTKRVVQYPHIREADIMWSKRVWRVIDLREKQNHTLLYPIEPISDRMSLWDVIKYGALTEGSLTIYELGPEFDDQFKMPVKPPSGNINDPVFQKQLEGFFAEQQIVPKLDEFDEPMIDMDGNEVFDTVNIDVTARDVIRYEIKEDWFFDKQRSLMDVRIIGLSPVIYYTNKETGDVEGTKNLFWLYFPECRYTFQNFYVYNPKNDAQKMSFDDLFWKREFSSYISKETGPLPHICACLAVVKDRNKNKKSFFGT